MKPTILFAAPPDSGIYLEIIKNLEYHGFEVIPLIRGHQKFRYPNLRTRLNTKFKQHILRQADAKRYLISQLLLQQHMDTLAQYPAFDYALFIRADLFHSQLIQTIKNKSRNGIINYQWDGMDRFPDIWPLVPLFDRFFVFDPDDINEHTDFLPTTNFYFDYDLTQTRPNSSDFYYIGSHTHDRVQFIRQFDEYAKKMNWKLNFYILSTKSEHHAYYRQTNITVSNQKIPLSKNLDTAKHSRVLVDFVISQHKGLSLRVFEALGYRKKLITTNAEIRHYDFYHPDNIYILTTDNFDGIAGFLDKPYIEIDPMIREKYSFGNWIKYLLNIHPHQPITLPKGTK